MEKRISGRELGRQVSAGQYRESQRDANMQRGTFSPDKVPAEVRKSQ